MMPRTEISASVMVDGPSVRRDPVVVSRPVPTRLKNGSRRPAGWYVNTSGAGGACGAGGSDGWVADGVAGAEGFAGGVEGDPVAGWPCEGACKSTSNSSTVIARR